MISEDRRLHAVGTDGRLVVWKFGGTSVADPVRLRAVAERMVAAHRAGHRVVAVLSAMGRSTDELLGLAAQVGTRPPARELDALLATGEQVSCALAAMAVHELGVPAVSLTGAQAGIGTDDAHGDARFGTIDPERIRGELDAGRIVLVTGFQGVTPRGDVATLGRGGSDASAVAVAAALGVSRCEIHTDVAGVFTADPRIEPDARLLPVIGRDQMLRLARAGAAVMQPRSVELGTARDVDIHVRSSFSSEPGTWIVADRCVAEPPDVVGIAHRAGDEREPGLGSVTLVGPGVGHRRALTARALLALERGGIEPRHVAGEPGHVTIRVPADAVQPAVRLLHRLHRLHDDPAAASAALPRLVSSASWAPAS